MTDRTDEFRGKAEHCRQMADRVHSPLDKEMWLQLAADWLTLASVRERSARASTGRLSWQSPVDVGATLARLFRLGFLLDAHMSLRSERAALG